MSASVTVNSPAPDFWRVTVGQSSVMLYMPDFEDIAGAGLTWELQALRNEINCRMNIGVPYSGFMIGKLHMHSTANGLMFSSGLTDPDCIGYESAVSLVSLFVERQHALKLLDDMIILSITRMSQ